MFDRKKIVLPLLFISSFTFAGDLAKNATIDIICTEIKVRSPRTIIIKSNDRSSIVKFNGVNYYGKQLIGYTEGGSPLMQLTNEFGGYNIIVSGADFEKAILSQMYNENGEADAKVHLIINNELFDAKCHGSFLFTDPY